MRYDLLVAFLLYPVIVNLVSVIAGVLLFFLQKTLRRKRYGKAAK